MEVKGTMEARQTARHSGEQTERIAQRVSVSADGSAAGHGAESGVNPTRARTNRIGADGSGTDDREQSAATDRVATAHGTATGVMIPATVPASSYPTVDTRALRSNGAPRTYQL